MMTANPLTQTFKSPEFFIFSSGRSGTTLLASMLNASQQVCIPYESDFIARAYPFFHDKQEFNQADYRQIAKIFKHTAKENGWGMDEDYVTEYLVEKNPQTYSDVVSTICAAYHSLEGTSDLIWGIKSPVLIASLDRISEVFPNAKLVHIVRDGRDVCLSYKNVHKKSQIKFGPKGIFENALYWIDGLRRIEDYVQVSQFYELRYEDLLSNPKAELSKLCGFLGIEYSPSMHDDFNSLERNQKLAPKQFMQGIHAKLSSGLDAGNTQKFKGQMSPLDLIKFELLTIPYLKRHGYAPVFPFLGLFLFSPCRFLLKTFARLFNDIRYRQRDKKMYQQAVQSQ